MKARYGEIDLPLVRQWGNHQRKFLVALERYYDELQEHVASLDEGAINLVGFPADAGAEMDLICRTARDPQQGVRLLGTYYSYHFVAMNQRRIRRLEQSVTPGSFIPAAHRELLGTLQAHSLALATGFVSGLAKLFGPPDAGKYLFCNVGAIWDHEDLDIWAVADRPEAVRPLGQICGRLAREALRWAQPVHFYLSEHLRGSGFAGTLDDYRAVLDNDLRNFVIVSQVFQATRLAGDATLYLKLAEDLRKRYLASEPPTPYHEGFLRGALTEVQSLATLTERVRIIDPKAEIYRLVRILLCCQAARLGIAVAAPWDVLNQAAAADGRRSVQYEALGRAFDFAEVLRYLFSIYYAQEVPVVLDDAGARSALEQVATLMGYTGDAEATVGGLLRDYRAHRGAVCSAAQLLGRDISEYLKSVSVFYRMLNRRTQRIPFDGLRGNLARILLRYVETHQGRVFWEDLVAICRDRPGVLDRWASDLARLRGRQLTWTIARYARLMQEDMARFYEYLLLLQAGDNTQSAIADLLLDEAINLYGSENDLLSRFAELFHLFPALVAEFVERQEPESTARLIALFRPHWETRRYRKAGVRLLSLLNLYHFSSNYSKRHSTRVLARYPPAITFLDDFDELARIADTSITDAAAQPTASMRRQRLGDFYDMEFCRLSLMTLSGVDQRRVGREFRRSSERYVAALFDSCLTEIVQAEAIVSRPSTEGFALFATGGNAREDPYDVDYDMFALLTDSDREKARFFNRVLARFTRALTERGIVPHNRFADRFGAYVATVDEVAAFLTSGEGDVFIEKTEMLGSRRVLGDRAVDTVLSRELIEPFVFDDPTYPLDLVGELRAQRMSGEADELEIKETPGGLRDVQLLLSILKARCRIRDPDSAALFAQLRVELPALTATLQEVEETVAFLKKVRDVYRLTVVSEDRLDPDYFDVVALFMGYGERIGGSGRALLADYFQALARVRESVYTCLYRLGLPTDGF